MYAGIARHILFFTNISNSPQSGFNIISEHWVCNRTAQDRCNYPLCKRGTFAPPPFCLYNMYFIRQTFPGYTYISLVKYLGKSIWVEVSRSTFLLVLNTFLRRLVVFKEFCTGNILIIFVTRCFGVNNKWTLVWV